MIDPRLQALVRAAVDRQFATSNAGDDMERTVGLTTASSCSTHPSHHLYLTVVNTTDACVIEPSVSCDHCGYCKSHGH